MKGISELISKLLRKSGERRLNQPHLVLPCRRFSRAEINRATNNFDKNLIIGRGRFGNVYKGFIDDRTISVAIKHVDIIHSRQGFHEFMTEVVFACQLRHPNFVPFIGYCLEGERHAFLVYELMVNGVLERHLYGTNPDPVPWKRRLQICIGVARGLHYLHTGLKHTIFHCGVKPSNILLDEKWEAKWSDFGLSKMGPPSLSKALIRIETDRIAGTYGYIAPEFAMHGEVTDKSDVYSFGVLLLELLSGRKPYEKVEQMDLVRWALKCKREGSINEIIDPYLMGRIAPECFMVYVDIATSCVRNRGERRPAMGEVQVCLEHALELQDSADAATAAAADCNYCVDEYTCNASSGDASPIDTVWETATESSTSAEELSLETAMPNGQI
ncbi:receptor-like protein kinase FERONIA [Quercus suber]|uniref:receptor-like protein kinase FERONIA n=1 Tax=Quercus suber TaxID=58331 RepID=UPI000CE20467|nr:receptor-like protein kinase FERONIA [Quercus suber]XP_023922755.1 receptor-like protein kinase FERONIA [Quercus suber]XP_023922756.1 receptor-like protein kinase FERONIA [Quercus suber]